MGGEDDETRFLGLLDILLESCNIGIHRRKIFLQISLFMILPLCFVYLAQIQISEIMFKEMMNNEFLLDAEPQGTQLHKRISNMLTTERAAFILFKVSYLLLFILLGLFSSSTVVYTIASIYAGNYISFMKVITVVPKVWKRLILTFLWSFIAVFVYNLVSLIVLIMGIIVFWSNPITGKVLLFGFPLIYLSGFFYITILWHLASIVSVLEESYGLNTLIRSQILIKGKMGIVTEIFLILGLSFFGIEHFFKFLVVFRYIGVGSGIGFGILCLILLSISALFGLIGQTIIYFIYKAYHNENIHESSLTDRFDMYFGEYVPLKSNEVPLEEYNV